MKIATHAVADTAFLHLKGPDGAFLYDDETKKPVGIDMFGPGSAEAAQVEQRASARVVRRMQENDNKVTLAPPEERRAETAQDVTALTAGFRHIEYDGPDGKPLAGTALFTAVYSDPKLGWIKEQALKFAGEWGKFSAGSATG